MAQHQRVTGPSGQNNAATFEPSMVQGSHPDQPRLFSSRNCLGLTIAQTTHVQAPFIPAMSQGYQPSEPVLMRGKTGWTWTEQPFLQMTVEQWEGEQPSRPRILLGPRIPLPISQTTHTSAAFSEDMAQGYHPDTPRLPFQANVGWSDSQLTFQVQMTPDMFAGSHPDTSRAFLGPRIPLPISQTTHQAAPFSQDMVAGHKPDFPRTPFSSNPGWQSSQLTFQVQMTPEMFAGHHPDTSRAWIAPRIPLPQSQPTHTAAPFNQDMVEGEVPSRARPHVLGKDGWSANQLTFVIQMTPDMFKGNIPDKNREKLGPKIPLPIAQTTHVQATFEPSMVQGSHPDRGFRYERKPGWQNTIVDSIATVFNVVADWLVKAFSDDSIVKAKSDDISVDIPPDDQVDPR